MSTEDNKGLLRRRLAEVWNQGNLAAVDELLAADYMLHDPAQLIRAPEGFKAYVSAFPDLPAIIEDQIAQEDRVAMRFGFSAPMRPDSALSHITFFVKLSAWSSDLRKLFSRITERGKKCLP